MLYAVFQIIFLWTLRMLPQYNSLIQILLLVLCTFVLEHFVFCIWCKTSADRRYSFLRFTTRSPQSYLGFRDFNAVFLNVLCVVTLEKYTGLFTCDQFISHLISMGCLTVRLSQKCYSWIIIFLLPWTVFLYYIFTAKSWALMLYVTSPINTSYASHASYTAVNTFVIYECLFQLFQLQKQK